MPPTELHEGDYLGDGVYAGFDGYHIWLTTENGISTTNEIALKPEVVAVVERYFARIKQLRESMAAKERKEHKDETNG